MNLGQINEAEKYLKIANQINPVSAPILIDYVNSINPNMKKKS